MSLANDMRAADLADSIRLDAWNEFQLLARRNGYAPTADDWTMVYGDVSSEDRAAWADDLEARCGWSVGEFRAHLNDLALVVDGAGCPEEADHVASLYVAHDLPPPRTFYGCR